MSKPRESLFMREGTGACEVHDWTPEQWRRDFVRLLRERHGKGGLNACRECLLKAQERLRAERGD